MNSQPTCQSTLQATQTNNNTELYYILEEINTSIKNFGYAPIDILLVNTQINHQVIQTLRRIIMDYFSALGRSRSLDQKIAKIQMDNRRSQLNLQNSLCREQALLKEKQELQEKIKFGQKQMKQKYEKTLKQKDEMFKEQKKCLDHKESSFKMQIKKYDEKNRVLQAKLKKYLEKEKVEYKNSFEVMNNLNNPIFIKKMQEQIQKQYEYQVTKMIVQEKERLELQVNFYYELLQEVYVKIKNIALSFDSSHLFFESQKNNNYQMAALPREMSDSFVKHMRKYLQFIQANDQKRQSKVSLSNLPQDVEKLASQNLKMRQYFQNWQTLYQQMKGMAKSSMSVALKRQNISPEHIKHIYDQLNENWQQSAKYDNQQMQQDSSLKIMLQKHQMLKKRQLEIEEYTAKKIKFIKHETKITNRVQRQMQNLLTDDLMES